MKNKSNVQFSVTSSFFVDGGTEEFCCLTLPGNDMAEMCKSIDMYCSNRKSVT